MSGLICQCGITDFKVFSCNWTVLVAVNVLKTCQVKCLAPYSLEYNVVKLFPAEGEPGWSLKFVPLLLWDKLGSSIRKPTSAGLASLCISQFGHTLYRHSLKSVIVQRNVF